MKIQLPNITPGEWRSEGTELIDDLAPGSLPHAVIRDPSDRWTALVEITDNEGEANAQAIAALPECLQALAGLYNVVADNAELLHEQGVHPDSFNHPLDAARAALLKAGATITE